MKNLQLTATTRRLLGKKVKRLRQQHQIPAVLYGHNQQSQPLTVDLKEFVRVYQQAGSSALINLQIDDQPPLQVLIHQPQVHYLTDQPIHADFYLVKMDEKIETTIPIHFVGQSSAVEEQEGNLITNKTELNIRCYPNDLVPSVEVDLANLGSFDDQIRIKDIKLPETIEVLDDPDDVVALVEAPRTEAELEAELAASQKMEVAEVEVLGRKSAEEQVSEEENQ